MDDGRKVNVVKLAEFKIDDYSVLVINKTDYSGQDKVDFRVWKNSPDYKGPTKQGFVLTMEKMNEFIETVSKIKGKIAETSKTSGKKKNKKKAQ